MKKDTNNRKDKTKYDGPEKPDAYMGNDKQWVFRALVLAFIDMCIIAISFFFALMIRFEFSYSHIPLSFLEGYLHIVPLFMVISLVVFYILRLYHSIWRFASINEFMHIIGAFLVLTVVSVTIHEVYEIKMPYAFWIIGLMLSFALCTACRFAYRFIRTGQKMLEQRGSANGDEKVMIIGAGNAGRMLIRELIMSSHLHTKACCIIDDNPAKLGRFIDGVPIVGNRNDIPEMVEKYDITKIVYAVPSTSGKDRKDILNICKDTGCDVSVVPGIYQMVDGRVSVSNLRPVSIEDLLGRDPVVVDNDGIHSFLQGKVVMVTGIEAMRTKGNVDDWYMFMKQAGGGLWMGTGFGNQMVLPYGRTLPEYNQPAAYNDGFVSSKGQAISVRLVEPASQAAAQAVL